MVLNISESVKGIIIGIVGVIVVFLLLSNLAPSIQNAGNNMTATGLPLANLFGGNGVIVILIISVVAVGIITIAMKIGRFAGK